jgi:uncharacterized protein YabN with tetrapyrrole methylase and pyrophosphatase domain
MIRRHPHVFGHLKGTVKDAEDVRGVWQAIKAEEKREKD